MDYELSSTLEKEFVMTGPEIINSDQGNHFTNAEYLGLLAEEGIKVSMDGKGRARDNSRTERFFKSLKYECVYLNEFEHPRALRKGITGYMNFYNTECPHQSLGYAVPEEIYNEHGRAAA